MEFKRKKDSAVIWKGAVIPPEITGDVKDPDWYITDRNTKITDLVPSKERIEVVKGIISDIHLDNVKDQLWDLERDGLTQSMLLEFLACRKRADLGYRQGWSSLTTSNAITFGTLFHACLEKYYQAKDSDIPKLITDCLQEYKESVTKERQWTVEDAENHALNEGFIRSVLPKYVDNYKDKDAGKQYSFVEKEFNVEIMGIRCRGKMDRVETNKDGAIWVVDTKTKSRIDPNIQDRLSYDPQVMLYILAYQTITGKLPAGFMLDIIQRPALRRGKEETLQHFVERVKKDVDESYFARIQWRLDPKEFEVWKEEFRQMVQEFKAWAEGRSATYRNPASCETRYGTCKFVKVCGLGLYDGLVKKTKVFSELGGK